MGSEFPTPEMERAQRELDARVHSALRAAREARAKLEAIEERERDEPPLTDDEVDRFATFITGHAHTDEWQAVIARIERGELSWRQVIAGVVEGRMDRAVAAAFTSLQRVPPASLEELVELGIAHPVDAGSAQPAEPTDDADSNTDTDRPAPRDDPGGRFYHGDEQLDG